MAYFNKTQLAERLHLTPEARHLFPASNPFLKNPSPVLARPEDYLPRLEKCFMQGARGSDSVFLECKVFPVIRVEQATGVYFLGATVADYFNNRSPLILLSEPSEYYALDGEKYDLNETLRQAAMQSFAETFLFAQKKGQQPVASSSVLEAATCLDNIIGIKWNASVNRLTISYFADIPTSYQAVFREHLFQVQVGNEHLPSPKFIDVTGIIKDIGP